MEIFLLNNLIILSVISSVLFATGSVIGRVGLIDEDPEPQQCYSQREMRLYQPYEQLT